MTNFRRTLNVAIFALTCVCAVAQTPTPVLVELFTSEGCSSCPPADAFLRTLDSTQPIQGAQLIVLGEHVDYWDDQGWRDIYSDHNFTVRQDNYVNRMGLKSSYTPQIIVDGSTECSGNDPKRAIAVIEKARAQSKVPLQISWAPLASPGDRAYGVSFTPSDGSGGLGQLYTVTTSESQTMIPAEQLTAGRKSVRVSNDNRVMTSSGSAIRVSAQDEISLTVGP